MDGPWRGPPYDAPLAPWVRFRRIITDIMKSSDREQLHQLAVYLTQRRASILQTWYQAVNADPGLTTASSISRTQFYDHIPQLLDAFADLLRAEDSRETQQAGAEQKKSASEHGLHRWQQGYNQYQTMREWSHLQLCLLDELESYAAAQPGSTSSAMHAARRALARLCADGVCESAARYARLQQAEAGTRVVELEQAIETSTRRRPAARGTVAGGRP